MVTSLNDNTDNLISSKKTNIVESKRSQQQSNSVFIIYSVIYIATACSNAKENIYFDAEVE